MVSGVPVTIISSTCLQQYMNRGVKFGIFQVLVGTAGSLTNHSMKKNPAMKTAEKTRVMIIWGFAHPEHMYMLAVSLFCKRNIAGNT